MHTRCSCFSDAPKGKPIYYAVFLTGESAQRLLSTFPIPPGWKPYAHHLTIKFGNKPNPETDPFLLENDGRTVTLTVIAVGINDKAMAVGVAPTVPTGNSQPHVTLAVPPGGAPKDSNTITVWEQVAPFHIEGVVGAFYGK